MNISITMSQKQQEKKSFEQVIAETYSHGISRLMQADSMEEVKTMQGYLLSVERFAMSQDLKIDVDVFVKENTDAHKIVGHNTEKYL